jgi:hypothetical protein
MSTDSQGRPLSDDGQWAWNGTEWVPAAGGGVSQPEAAADPNATMITPSPFAAGGAPAAGAPAPGYAETPAYGAAPGYGAAPAPGYGAAQPDAVGFGAQGYPGGAGAPPPHQKSRKPLILGIVGGLLVVAVVAVVLILTLGKSSDSGPKGAFKCSVPGSADTGTITFNAGKKYALSDQGKPGSYTKSGDKLTFTGGSLDKSTATYNKSAKSVVLSIQGQSLTCKQ